MRSPKINTQENIILRVMKQKKNEYPDGITPSKLAELCGFKKPSTRRALRGLRLKNKVTSSYITRFYTFYKLVE